MKPSPKRLADHKVLAADQCSSTCNHWDDCSLQQVSWWWWRRCSDLEPTMVKSACKSNLGLEPGTQRPLKTLSTPLGGVARLSGPGMNRLLRLPSEPARPEFAPPEEPIHIPQPPPQDPNITTDANSAAILTICHAKGSKLAMHHSVAKSPVLCPGHCFMATKILSNQLE